MNVRNTGKVLGTETVQVYAGRLPVPVETAPKALAGWAKVTLAPGESRDVTVTLDPQSLSYWDVGTHAWKLAVGDVPVMVGASSADVRLTGTIPVTANDVP